MILPREYSNVLPRLVYNCRYGYRCSSRWNRWGRWVLAGILIFIGIFLVFFLLCCRNRRRRRAHPNVAPIQPVTQNQGYNNQNPAGYGGGAQYPPPPGAPPPVYSGGANQGYYGPPGGGAPPGNNYQGNGGYK